MSKSLVIIGLEPFIGQAAAIARENEPEREVSLLPLPVQDRFKFDFSAFDALDSQICELFVALDERALNFSRLEMVSMLKARGFAMARLISRRALVDPNHRVGENTIVQVGAAVSSDARIGYNAVIGPGVTVGAGARIGNSAYLSTSAVVGAGAAIGDGSTLGSGVVVAPGIKIGKLCELSVAGVYETDVPDKSFYAPGYDGPVRILKF